MPKGLELLNDTDLALLMDGAEARTFASGESLLTEGETVDGLYFIRKGVVGIRREADLASYAVNTIGVDEVLGEVSFVEDATASASIVATEDVEVDFVPRAHVESLLSTNKHFASRFYHSLARTLAGRLRHAHDHLLDG